MTTQPGNSTDVRQWAVTLEDSAGHAFDGCVIDFDDDAVTLCFAKAGAPLLGIAQQATLRIRAPGSDNSEQLAAYVVARTDDSAQRSYEFQPRRKGEFARLRTSGRGGDVRVRPSPNAPVHVELSDEMGQRLAAATAIDVSANGIGIVLESSDELALRAHERLMVVVRLSDTQRRSFVASIRSRRLVGALIRIGLEFEPQRSPAYADAEEWLKRYVVRRQREMLTTELG